MLRHALATLAYRGGKTLRGASPAFAQFRTDPSAKPPVAILAHIGDLLDWSLTLAQGHPAWSNAEPLAWELEVERFFTSLEKLDARLASEAPLECDPGRLFQGPIADALTHVGQLAMLRRMAGEPMRGENYFVAEIQVGRVGADQAAPVREF
jgi:hypothetical protein